MDSRSLGYSYNYSFAEAGLHEIISRWKSIKMDEDCRYYFFEVRSEFFIVWRDCHEELFPLGREIIGSERFDASDIIITKTYPSRVLDSATKLRCRLISRLCDYWMSNDVIASLCNDAIAFAEPIAARRASSNRIAIVINLEVNTVQQEGESVEDTEDRAIMPHKLLPLYLWSGQSAVRKSVPEKVQIFLVGLSRVRVESAEMGRALMDICSVCERTPYIGDEITKLETCGCAFHHHCIIMKLEGNNVCPQCESQAYDPAFLKDMPIENLLPDIRFP